MDGLRILYKGGSEGWIDRYNVIVCDKKNVDSTIFSNDKKHTGLEVT